MNRLTAVKEYLQLPSYKISESVGRGKGAFSDWERGVANLRFSALVKFQEIHGVSPDYILFGEGSIGTTGDYKYDFCARLKNERNNRRMSQGKFAELLDVSRQYYNYIETGKLEPSREFLISLYGVTGKPISYFIGGQ